MDANFQACADATKAEEGGYSGGRGDAGNWTGGAVGRGVLAGSMYGVSAPVLVEWLGGDESKVSAAVMRALDDTTFRAIARARYWRALDGDKLPAGLDGMLFDFGYNSGVSRAAKHLQQVIGLAGADLDGDIGPLTLKQLAAAPLVTVLSYATPPYVQLLQQRLGFTGGAVDGRVGPGTLAAVTAQGALDLALICAVASMQKAAYRSFTTFPTYGAGWLSRLGRRTTRALDAAMAARGTSAA